MRKCPQSSLLICLVALAFLAKAVIPAGFMPHIGNGTNALVTIEICTSSGLVKTLTKSDHAPAQQHGEKESASKCPYAPVLAYGSDTHAPLLTQTDFMTMPPLYEVAQSLTSPAIPKDWFSTAPPFSV